MDVYHNIVIYSEADAQVALNTLSECNCCQRHQQKKPLILQRWVELPLTHRIQTNNDCHCPCRHMARFICRDWGEELENNVVGGGESKLNA